jgi:LysR family nitrogen assimilation transcriptional regulator
VQSHALDLALVFEDELVSAHSRNPIFSQQLFLIGKDAAKFRKPHVSLEDLVGLPLISPGGQRNRRQLINRTFAARADGVVIALRAGGELNILYGM